MSIVIPAFNEEDGIAATIDACFASDYPSDKFDVVVVDDGSSDKTWERMLEARDRNPAVVCIRFHSNRGKRAAMAEGIRRSRADICAFVQSLPGPRPSTCRRCSRSGCASPPAP